MNRNPQAKIDASDGTKVLVVDDQEFIRLILKSGFEGMGAQVVLATSGQEALKIWQDCDELGLVLIDQQLPDMTGAELLRQMKKARRPVGQTKIFAMSAASDESMRERVLAAGFVGFLAKPLRKSDLASLIGVSVNSSVDQPESLMETHFKTINPKEIIELFGTRERLLQKSLARFVNNSEAYHEAILTALAAGQRDESLRKIHSLRGMMRYFGAQLEGDLGSIESRIADGAVLNDLIPLVAGLRADMNVLIAEVAELEKSLKTGSEN